ncbi:MAG: hypothetical protein AAB373_02180 [Patescibacteria group bacterium]
MSPEKEAEGLIDKAEGPLNPLKLERVGNGKELLFTPAFMLSILLVTAYIDSKACVVLDQIDSAVNPDMTEAVSKAVCNDKVDTMTLAKVILDRMIDEELLNINERRARFGLPTLGLAARNARQVDVCDLKFPGAGGQQLFGFVFLDRESLYESLIAGLQGEEDIRFILRHELAHLGSDAEVGHWRVEPVADRLAGFEAHEGFQSGEYNILSKWWGFLVGLAEKQGITEEVLMGQLYYGGIQLGKPVNDQISYDENFLRTLLTSVELEDEELSILLKILSGDQFNMIEQTGVLLKSKNSVKWQQLLGIDASDKVFESLNSQNYLDSANIDTTVSILSLEPVIQDAKSMNVALGVIAALMTTLNFISSSILTRFLKSKKIG